MGDVQVVNSGIREYFTCEFGILKIFLLGIRNPWLWYLRYISKNLVYATDETTLWLSPSAKQRRNPCSGPYLCTRIWVSALIGLPKKPSVDLPISLKGNPKRISSNSLRQLEAQIKDFGAALQTSLTGVKLHLQRRLKESGTPQTIGVQNLSSTDKDWNPVPGIRIRGLECRIQDCFGFPDMGWLTPRAIQKQDYVPLSSSSPWFM